MRFLKLEWNYKMNLKKNFVYQLNMFSELFIENTETQ